MSNVKIGLPAFAFASVILSLATSGAGSPLAAATPKPTATPTAPVQAKDPCSATKSKWAHLQCEEFNSSAPGDEYFGRMKLSYLGIDNTYKDGSISAGDVTTDPRLISKLDFATDALRRWASKYPNDPQLARSYYLGVLVLRKVYTQPEQDVAWQFIELLTTKYANTYFGKQLKASIAKDGFTEHWFAVATICPTPVPRGTPLQRGATPQPTPEDTPAPTPTPSPAPGKPAVEIITPPCVPPSTADSESP